MAKSLKILVVVLIVMAIGLRLYDLDRGDPISDEVLYGFRAIGYLDFDFAKYQPGLPQLFENKDIPFWTKLSFHDHPPLVFLVQHFFIKIGGDNLWALRFPSALFGLASIYLLYLIARKLFSHSIAWLATALMSVNVLMIYLSRTAVQEAQLVFFILLTVYFFLCSLTRSKYFLWTGLALALGLLTKYTILFLIPALVLYLLFYHRNFFRNKYLYGGGLISLLIFSPVIIYNILLWRTFGHFDFQWSYFFGQAVSYWQEAPGKEIGDLSQRFVGIFTNSWSYNSWLFSILSGLSLATFLISIFQSKYTDKKQNIFLLLIIIFNLILYLLVGPSPRFLSMIVPWLALLVAWFLVNALKKQKIIFYLTIFLILSWEFFYTINSYIVYQPQGKEIWTYSRIHWDEHVYGFNELDKYLGKLLVGQYPVATIPYKYDFLEDIKREAVNSAKDKRFSPAKTIIVYDENMADLAALWVLNRRALYQAWPFLPVSSYQQVQAEMGENFSQQMLGFNIYFIQATGKTLLIKESERHDLGRQFVAALQSRGLEPETIYSATAEPAFYIYHWVIE